MSHYKRNSLEFSLPKFYSKFPSQTDWSFPSHMPQLKLGSFCLPNILEFSLPHAIQQKENKTTEKEEASTNISYVLVCSVLTSCFSKNPNMLGAFVSTVLRQHCIFFSLLLLVTLLLAPLLSLPWRFFFLRFSYFFTSGSSKFASSTDSSVLPPLFLQIPLLGSKNKI